VSDDLGKPDIKDAALTLATFAGHDDDCLINRLPSEGIVPNVCSCGYVAARNAVFAALDLPW
jgi:hypothetical protein